MLMFDVKDPSPVDHRRRVALCRAMNFAIVLTAADDPSTEDVSAQTKLERNWMVALIATRFFS